MKINVNGSIHEVDAPEQASAGGVDHFIDATDWAPQPAWLPISSRQKAQHE